MRRRKLRSDDTPLLYSLKTIVISTYRLCNNAKISLHQILLTNLKYL